MEFALRYGDRVEKLIVVDIAPRAYSPRHEKILQAMLSLDLPAFETRKEIEEALAPAVPELATRQFLLKNVTRAPGQTFHWKLGLREIAGDYARLSEPPTATALYGKPVLFVRGEASDFLLDEDISLIRGLFPQAELRTIPRAGHLPHVENPAAFLQTVNEFLAADQTGDEHLSRGSS